MTTTTPNYPAPWTPLDELTEGNTPPDSDGSAQSCASPITPHASPGCEINPPVVARESCGSLASPTGDEYFAPVANPALLEELLPDFSLQSQAKPAETTSQNDKPSPDGPISQGAPLGEEDTAVRDAPSLLFPELTESLEDFQETYSRDPSYDVVDPLEDLASPDFQWEDPPMDALPGPADDSGLPWELLKLDETGQGPPSSSTSVAATHSEAQSPWTQLPASQPQAAINTGSSSDSSPELPPPSQDQREEAQSQAEADRSNLTSDVSNTDFPVKSFSSFMSPLKPRPRASNSRLPHTPSLLAAATGSPRQASSTSKKCVPWAPLPHEIDDSPAPISSFSHASPRVISHRDAGPPLEILPALLACVLVGISMSSLPRRTPGVCSHPSYYRRPNRLQKQCPSAPPEDDDVIFVKSVPRKRPHDHSGGASDNTYPAKRPRPSRVNLLLTQVTRQFHDGDRMYNFNRATKSWQDRHDDTILPDVRFDEGGDYKTLTVKVHPRGLSGMPVFLSWDEEKRMFCGYDIEGAERLVGRDDVKKLMESRCKSLKIEWPGIDDSF